MIMEHDAKHAYVFGNSDVGVHGYTTNKHVARIVKEKRGNQFDCHKTNCDTRFRNASKGFDEYVIVGEYPMTETEEEYYIESFNQFLNDSARSTQAVIECIKYLKLSETEKTKFEILVHILNDYLQYYNHGQYDDDMYGEVYDQDASVEYFIKHCLDGR